MMMEGLLRDLDLEVVGPFGTVNDALEAVRHEAIDAALLDVNLGGEMAYPIAQLLAGEKGALRLHDRIWIRDHRHAVRECQGFPETA